MKKIKGYWRTYLKEKGGEVTRVREYVKSHWRKEKSSEQLLTEEAKR